LQHHFGDAGDDGRGCLLVDPIQDTVEFIQNPNWDTFRIIRLKSGDDLLLDKMNLKEKKVSIIFEDSNLKKEEIQQEILNLGALSVRKHGIHLNKIKQSPELLPGNNFNELIRNYLKHSELKEEEMEEYFQMGMKIFKDSNLLKRENGNTFDATLKSISIQNFLGIQKEIQINFEKMNDGIHFITGNVNETS
jgi:hypothetical protein